MKTTSFRDSGYPKLRKKLDRRAIPSKKLRDTVSAIIDQVAKEGDKALCEFTQKFDKVALTPKELFVTEKEFEEAFAQISPATKRAVRAARKNIHAFAKASMRKDWSHRNEEGAKVGERFVPFDRVGIYIPGGKAPLVSTALMTGAFAQAAKVPQIVAATPVGKDGKVNPALLYALRQAGVTEVLKVGGAQAIAALSLGTKKVAPVDKVFGPGNQFVVEAKRQLVGAVSIDLLPGPSEIMVIADTSGNPDYIAADLLAQAEHGGDSEIALITTSKRLLTSVQKAIEKQTATLSRGEVIREVLLKNTTAILTQDLDEAIEICNEYAPEHLSLIVKEEKHYLKKVRTAGAIYLGNDSPVAVGDFLAGPSHTLPTGGAGKSFSGLRADQFQRRTSIVKLDKKSIRRSLESVQEFARIEGLDAHGESVAIRLVEK